MKVRDVMTSNITAADSNTSISEIAKKMRDLNIGAIPICDEQNYPIGIVTDRDIVIRGVVEGLTSNDNVAQIMSKQVIYVTPDMHVHEATRLMGENQIRRLPVVENGKIIGMVSIGDLAVQNIYEDDAGHALSEISTPSRPMM
ncbi:CBS domain-containing protein [Alkaliphilus peptidifermentans]|uniref:CBS domain-containing protein n=1 Tax=Alkaliphilus peptidifermentans DSM 18978 TaxID=1120976 RepID=A0A1G5K3N1_9FIRM|nr:CBS domain-containing protein [Alkaliphilus peptidifermentans]SCY95064.1 CBS domain-containing protein [Alkaliphilus peptidifermentans DSM 18978]